MRKIHQTPSKPSKPSVSVELAQVLHQQALELWQPPKPSAMEQLLRGWQHHTAEDLSA